MNPTLLQFISANHLAIAAGCAGGLGMCFFFCGVQLFAHRHSSDRAPRITVGAAVPGLATISGKTAGSRTLASPSAGRPCFVYRACIMQLHESAGKNEWKNVAEESGHLTFLLEDETGQLLVEPSGAELDLCQNISQEYGSLSSYSPDPLSQLSGTSPHNQSSNRETVPHAFTDFLARNGVSLDRPTRVEEYCLEPETPVVITGTVTENSPMQADSPASTSAAASNNQRLVLAKPVVEQPEVIRLTNGATPQSTTQMSQQGKIAAALARAGLATADMWVTSEGGLQAINSLIDSHSRPDQLPADTKFEALATRALVWTPVTMAKGSDDTTFIISNRHQSPKPPSLGWKSVALVLAGSTLTTISLYVLLLAHLR